MPRNYAKRLAEILTEDQSERIEVDLMDTDFASEVATELRKMGFKVDLNPRKPTHLTVLPKVGIRNRAGPALL